MFKTKPVRIALAGAALLTGAIALQTVTPLSAQSIDEQSREDIEKIVREYILANPGIIFEAAELYEAQQAEQAAELAKQEVRANFSTLVSASSGFATGASADDADVIVVEFFDYHCGYCKNATDFVMGLTDKDKSLRLVLQELPVVHQLSRDVAIAALAAPDTKTYTDMHLALMQHSGLIDDDTLVQVAENANIDFGVFRARLDNEADRSTIEAKLNASMELAYAIGIDGTPGFVVASADGKHVEIISGFNPPAVKAAIKDIRKASKG